MIQIICDNCGKKINSLSNKPTKEKQQGIEFNKKHICAHCINEAFKDDE